MNLKDRKALATTTGKLVSVKWDCRRIHEFRGGFIRTVEGQTIYADQIKELPQEYSKSSGLMKGLLFNEWDDFDKVPQLKELREFSKQVRGAMRKTGKKMPK